MLLERVFDDDSSSLLLRKIYPENNNLSPFVIIDGPFYNYYYTFNNLMFASVENGKDLIVVYSRSREDGQCGLYDTSGCLDVFYSASGDDGKSWETPRRIYRENMNDRVNRVDPILMYLKETGRVFIFYTHYVDREDDTWYLKFVTKPKGSTIFSNEAIIMHFPHGGDAIPVYTFNNNKATVHIVYSALIRNEYTHFYYTYSDNLIDWHETKEIYVFYTNHDTSFFLILQLIRKHFMQCLILRDVIMTVI